MWATDGMETTEWRRIECQPGGLLDSSRGLSEGRAIPPDRTQVRYTPDGVLEMSHVGSHSGRFHHPCRGEAIFPVIRGYRSLRLAQPPATLWLSLWDKRRSSL